MEIRAADNNTQIIIVISVIALEWSNLNVQLNQLFSCLVVVVGGWVMEACMENEDINMHILQTVVVLWWTDIPQNKLNCNMVIIEAELIWFAVEFAILKWVGGCMFSSIL